MRSATFEAMVGQVGRARRSSEPACPETAMGVGTCARAKRKGAAAGVVTLAVLLLASTPPAWAARDVDQTAKAQLSFGVDMAERGLWSEALFRFRQAARQDPENPRVLNNLAVAYEALGRFDEALEQYQKAIRADPASKELKRNYSRFVEFYRAFRPDQQVSGAGDSSPPP